MIRAIRSCFLLMLAWASVASVADAAGIPIQELALAAPPPGQVTVEALLPGEVEEVTTDRVSLSGPVVHEEQAEDSRDTVYLFLSGRGSFRSADQSFEIDGETIARAPLGSAVTVEVPKGATLHYVRIRKQLRPEDLADMKTYPTENRTLAYVKKFRDCPAYGEAIKSAKTVSRTLLPEGYVPRVAMGTVETTGPDEVAAHRHAMLDQLFLGLAENDITVRADQDEIAFPQFTLLHIPLGSSHGAGVLAGKKLYYVWMDFFSSKEGQEWLKGHKPVEEKKDGPAK